MLTAGKILFGLSRDRIHYLQLCRLAPRPHGPLKWNLHAFKVGVTIMYAQYAQINELQTNYAKMLSATTDIKSGQILPSQPLPHLDLYRKASSEQQSR